MNLTNSEIYKECLANNHAAKVLLAKEKWMPTLCSECKKKINDSIHQARVERDARNYSSKDETYQADKSGNKHDELHNRLSDVTEQQLFNALRAVVELHKPIAFDGEKGLFCNKCLPDRYRECETIQAIEKELG